MMVFGVGTHHRIVVNEVFKIFILSDQGFRDKIAIGETGKGSQESKFIAHVLENAWIRQPRNFLSFLVIL